MIGIALLADDRLKVTRCFELRFGVLALPLRAPERVRLRELEADEIADTTETCEILGREGPTGEHRGETADDLVLPDDRRHRERVGETAVRERERHSTRRLFGGALAHRLREHRCGHSLAPLRLGGEVVGDVRRVALTLHVQNYGDRVGPRDLREVRHARVPEIGVESEGHPEALRHAGAGLALDAELQGGAAAALQSEVRLF